MVYNGRKVMTALARLQASTAALGTSIDSVITAFQNQPNNDAALNAVSDSLDAQKVKIDAAVSALTPSV